MELDALTEQELKEIFKDLEEQGWEPRLCDTAVPYFENAVMCGNPADVGDLIWGMEMYPRDFFDNENEFMAMVRGDSMKDVNIIEGDKVIVRATKSFQDGDILVVLLDGDYTLKSFCKDEEGRPWLIPQNAAYMAFPLNETQNVRVRGVVIEVIKSKPRVAFRSCMKEINRARAASTEVKTISPQQVSQAIREVAPMIKVARQWYAVFRAMVDVRVIEKNGYDMFIDIVKKELPNHPKLPQRAEMHRLDMQSFSRPISLWRSDNAPVKGKRFNEYLSIAKRTLELLNS